MTLIIIFCHCSFYHFTIISMNILRTCWCVRYSIPSDSSCLSHIKLHVHLQVKKVKLYLYIMSRLSKYLLRIISFEGRDVAMVWWCGHFCVPTLKSDNTHRWVNMQGASWIRDQWSGLPSNCSLVILSSWKFDFYKPLIFACPPTCSHLRTHPSPELTPD